MDEVDFESANSCDYISVPTFNSCYVDKNKLRIIHQNIRSFNKNYDEFSVFLKQFSLGWDVLIFSETWFSEK